ncbi:MAG: CPBP family intramembrane metalloprotease [Planctomyces sp.]|nr:CPBP family intramembrane metalloprotease [Planctomyces sp.]
MNWKNIRLVFLREVRDQLRDRRTLFIITILPVLMYPLLGLGIVEMMLTFGEQRHTVVVLNDQELPAVPSLLDEQGFAIQWFEGGADDAPSLRVVRESGAEGSNKTPLRPGEASPEQLIEAARSLASMFRSVHGQDTHEELNLVQQRASGRIRAQDLKLKDAQEELNRRFAQSGIQVLVMIPPGYQKSLHQLEEMVRNQSSGNGAAGFPPILVVSNGADDKSAVAFARVRGALLRWENAIRENTFAAASLPVELQSPGRFAWLEIARAEQVSASVWSKLFPAMLVIMSLTGAFYTAIDLGAGEKERGTMETLLISPARRVEIVLGKFLTIILFSIGTAILNLLSMGITGQQMVKSFGSGLTETVRLELPGMQSLLWMVILLIPLAAFFSALCLALATFARSTKEGQYYLTPLLMVVMGLTMFCLSPSVEMTPLYSVLPVVNVALLLRGLLLDSPQSVGLVVYAIPVLVSSLGYAMLALWWAIDLYSREDVLFREAEKFDLRSWITSLIRTKDAVPAFPEAVFCFVLILMLHFAAMTWLTPDISGPNSGRLILRTIVVQQLVMVACPAVFMGLLLTTSPRATFRLRKPKLISMLLAVGMAVFAFPLSYEFSHFLVAQRVFPELPQHVREAMSRIQSGHEPLWLLVVVYALTPAICEELAFRGFILSGLARGGRLAIAIVISSMMFGIIHMIPQQAFNAALLGLLLGLLAVYSRSLFPTITFHLCFNAIATLQTRASGIEGFMVPFCWKDESGAIRFHGWFLLPAGCFLLFSIVHMIRTVIREQDLKRRGIIAAYSEEPVDSNLLYSQQPLPSAH